MPIIVKLKRKLAGRLKFSLKSGKLWLVIIIFIAGLLFFYYLGTPSKGLVKTVSPADIKEPTTLTESLWDKTREAFVKKTIKIEEEERKREGYSTYSGKYLSFQYPNSYDLKTKESSSSGILEKAVLLGAGISLRKLAVTVTQMTNADTLDDVSGVAVRRLKPKLYQEKPLDASGTKGILFEKKESGFEKTAFFLADQIAVTIALTSVNRDSDLDADFDVILKELTLFSLD